MIMPENHLGFLLNCLLALLRNECYLNMFNILVTLAANEVPLLMRGGWLTKRLTLIVYRLLDLKVTDLIIGNAGLLLF